MSIGLRFLTIIAISFLFIMIFGLFSPFSQWHLFAVIFVFLLINIVGILLILKSKEKPLINLLISVNIYILFFLIVGFILNTTQFDCIKGRSLYAGQLVNTGLIGLGISYLFFKADKLKLGRFYDLSFWAFIVSLMVLGTGSFDILHNMGYSCLALIAGITGWLIGPIIVVTLYRKFRGRKT